MFVYLNDGTSFYFYKGECIDFIFDTNGDIKPNQEGQDMFRFLYCPYADKVWAAQGKIIPYKRKTMTTRAQALSMCKSDGRYCTALLAEDGWQFKADYPRRI